MSLLSGLMDRSSLVRRHGLLWLGLAAFVAAIVFVNPLRDMPLEDDWAYAWSVERLVETGRFEAHEWAAANPVLPVYWGWLFSTLFGFSFAVLRVSTLVLAVVGWVAFYFLAKHHGLDNDEAGVLALALFASPLVFRFSLNFMSDVPFLVWVIVALLLYSQAIRRESVPLMALASLAAAGAVLTRQFGVALIGGLVLSWALDRNRRRWLLLCLLGLALPVAAALWQLAYGLGSPSWGMRYNMLAQRMYLAKPWLVAAAIPWRLTVVSGYVPFFALPFVLVAAGSLVGELRGDRTPMPPRAGFNGTTGLTILAVAVVAGLLYGRIVYGHSVYLPYMDGNFDDLRDFVPCARRELSLLTSAGALLFARIVILRYRRPAGPGEGGASEWLLDLVTLLLLAFHMVFFNFWDEYLLVFLPYVLIVVGRHVSRTTRRFRSSLVIACLVMLGVSAMWTRGILEREEALWAGAEALRREGIAPQRIYGYWTWNGYYSFQDYLADIGNRTLGEIRDYFERWVPEREQSAQFVLADGLNRPNDRTMEVIKEIPYRNALFEQRRVFVLKRKPPQ
jgi:hypothetical protein